MAAANPASAPGANDYGGDEISALVLDPGSATTRAGFAGEDAPKSVVPTAYGRTSDEMYLFGDNAVHLARPGMQILSPMDRDGTVEDWDAATKLWEYAITSRLLAPKSRNPMANGLNDPPKATEAAPAPTGGGGGGEGGAGDAMDVDGGSTEAAAEQQREAAEKARERQEEQQESLLAESPLLMTEPDWNSSKNREKALEIAMEEWGCPAFWLAKSGVLSAFAAGKPTALVIDIGAQTTSVTPVHDGLVLRKGVVKSPNASLFISDQLRHIFSAQHPPITMYPHYLVSTKTPVDAGTPAVATYKAFRDGQAPHASFRAYQEERLLTEFKESIVQVWPGPGKFSSNSAGGGGTNEDAVRAQPGRPFEFPDGYNQVFGADRYRAAEGLFDPKAGLGGSDTVQPAQTIPQMIQAALSNVDVDVRPHLLANTVVTGGGSLTQGMVDRINHDMVAAFPGPRVKIHAAGNLYERRFGPWIGGSILASLGSFHQMWISRKEYEEQGASIVEKRCK